MSDQGRIRAHLAGRILACIIVTTLPNSAFAQVNKPWPPEMLADADLHDVFFLDNRHGWAVGDRGVIWHTADGGAQWNLQSSPVACRLQGVYFVDKENGWAVGGWTQPYTLHSNGVVLRTRNGGRLWTRIQPLTLPALTHVHFSDPMRGWAAGYGSTLYPSGVFHTTNGGRNWSTIPSGQGGRWVTASFLDPRRGVVVGSAGEMAVVSRNGSRRIQFQPRDSRRVRDLHLDASGVGYLVGDRGLVVTTDDGGMTWRRPATRLPAGMEDQFDFTSVSARDGHCWIAGSPGTTVFRLTDGSQVWEAFDTEHQLPIRALTFVNAHDGWAVGALGTILSSGDGGVTWHRQNKKGAGTRTSIVGIYDRPESVPWELIAYFAGNQGHRLRIVLIGCPRDEAAVWGQMPLASRLHDASVAVAATGTEIAWCFPVPSVRLDLPATTIVQSWPRSTVDAEEPTHDLDRLEEYLVRAVRLWRPDCLLTGPVQVAGADELSLLVAHLVESSVRKAADQTAYPDQIALAGLRPWQVRKVASHGVDQHVAQARTVSTRQLVLPLGMTIADLGMTARGIVTSEFQPNPPRVSYRTILSNRPIKKGERLFDGLPQAQGADGRRTASEVLAGNLQSLRRIIQQRRNIEALTVKTQPHSSRDGARLSQIVDLTAGFDQAATGDILFQLAKRFQMTGREQLAAEVREMLIRRTPSHPLAEVTLMDLVRYHCSAERRWRHRDTVRLVQNEVDEPAVGVRDASVAAATLSLPLGQQTASIHRSTAPDRATSQEPWSRVQALEKFIQGTRPELFAQPEVRLSFLSTYRARGLNDQRQRNYRSLLASLPTRAWRACVAGEIWLETSRGTPPKPTWTCHVAAQRPRLDGVLEEAAWQSGQPVVLHSLLDKDRGWPAAVWLAYDREFLFLAARCRKAPGVRYVASTGARPRDANLDDHDRIELFMDVNRDYTSFWRLAIDHRGWTSESCLGDTTWDPTWYVASNVDEQHWYVEAAIPIRALSSKPPTSGDTWAIGIQRTVPGAGFQAWTHPASPDTVRPEGFGYLMFE